MKNNWLLKTGYLSPILFWITILICGFLTPGYSHMENMVSELGEIGSQTQYIFASGLILTAILSIFFNISLYKTCRKSGLNVIPVLLLWTFSFSILGAAIFPLPLKLHGILGSPSIILFLSPLLAIFYWKIYSVKNIKLYFFLSFAVMLLGFLVLFPNILQDYFGLKQRLFHLGWSVWFIYLTFLFIKIEKGLSNSGKIN